MNSGKKFIYVFNQEAKEKLLEAGMKIVKEDARNKIYVFVNEPCGKFALKEVSYIEDDVLTF